jgi:type II secretory pathway pseudopilin PulG
MSPSRAAPHRGFTLFQLLLLLVLLVILFGLLLPLLQKAREYARSSQDVNNLRQICLAIHNCNDTNGKLPPLVGPYPNADATAANNGYGCLFFHILPYIEQDNLYRSAFDGKTYRADTNGVRARIVRTYVSQSDPDGGKETVVYEGWLAPGNYAANFQVFGDPKTNSLAGQSKLPASIPDGLSNTMFFTQRYQNCNGDPCAWGYDGGTAWTPAFAYLNQGKFQARPAAEHCDSSLAQSLQPEAIHVGMGDGSARRVAASVSPETWWSACTPAGGEVLGPDW